MVIQLEDCKAHMTDDERNIFEEKTATDFFRYIYDSPKFQEILSKFQPNNKINEGEWLYLFEKLYLVTYKSLQEEVHPRLFDRITYLLSKVGTVIFSKDTQEYNDFYKSMEIIRSYYRNIEVDDDLLRMQTEIMTTRSVEDLETLLKVHKEACVFRNNRDYMYHEEEKSKDGELSYTQRAAINSFNRSYEREKELVLKYDNML